MLSHCYDVTQHHLADSPFMSVLIFFLPAQRKIFFFLLPLCVLAGGACVHLLLGLHR